ncbi:MAG TPA: prepilin-type N-terminal cleavage/methylation domain-containing protein [Desulfomonilaceae bacterium]|nr:prepilin-type N-terminal cleavage/methylation domain-containing protein [Desulfomonilaceae bacterium]
MKERGFTFPELLVVLFIGAIIFILGSFWMGRQISVYKYNNALAAFKLSVNLGRIRAMGQAGGAATTIFLDRIAVNAHASGQSPASQPPARTIAKNVQPSKKTPSDPTKESSVTFTVRRDPCNASDVPHHKLDSSKHYYVILTGCNPQDMLSDFPWELNDRLYECDAPDQSSIRCKLAGLDPQLETDPMALCENAVARVATVIRLSGWSTGQEIDATTKECMGPGEYVKIKDNGYIIDFRYNKNNMKALFAETDETGKRKEIDCETEPSNIVFDHSGSTKNATTYEICFEQPKTRSRVSIRISSSGVVQ